MSYRNEKLMRTQGLPIGLYWGVYLGNEREGAWKIDIWAMDKAECERRLDHCRDLSKRISASQRLIILNIKSNCWKDPAYRKSYTSSDIYSAVLDEGVQNFGEFRKRLQNIF